MKRRSKEDDEREYEARKWCALAREVLAGDDPARWLSLRNKDPYYRRTNQCRTR